mmetsp:Transcript_16011/g.45957  ORF Transcript_16011/g.45957 Transcript_16011/m.45957 type:complete len:222 (+) Transcript_16011:372-1037(+)
MTHLVSMTAIPTPAFRLASANSILPFSDRGFFEQPPFRSSHILLPSFPRPISTHFRRHRTIRSPPASFSTHTDREDIKKPPPASYYNKLCKRTAAVQPNSLPNPHRAAKLTSNPWTFHRAIIATRRRKKETSTSAISPLSRLVRSGVNTATAIRNRETKWRSNRTRRWHVGRSWSLPFSNPSKPSSLSFRFRYRPLLLMRRVRLLVITTRLRMRRPRLHLR